MVKITWSKIAVEDLRSIYDYISKDSETYAARVCDNIVMRVDQLERFPKSGRIVPEFNDSTLRELIQNNYRIVYKISPDTVSIIRIHHSARLLT